MLANVTIHYGNLQGTGVCMWCGMLWYLWKQKITIKYVHIFNENLRIYIEWNAEIIAKLDIDNNLTVLCLRFSS